jgi:predicted dehydrogenase
MDTNKVPNFGIIGAGLVAQAYAGAFRECKLAQVVAVTDVRPEAAADMAEGLGCRSFADYKEMAEQCQLDAVVVCTPPVTHFEICMYFLDRGVHVLCEKPLSIEPRSAKLMLDNAKERGVILTMASKFRFVQDVIRAKSLLSSGIIGDAVLMQNVFTSRVDMSQRWTSVPELSGGGVLIDNGTHSVDIMRYFLGPLTEIYAIEGKRLQSPRVEDTVEIMARSASGTIASSTLSWSINTERENFIEIYGTRGEIMIGWQRSKYRTLSAPKWVEFGSGYKKIAAFLGQLESFIKAITFEQPSPTTAEDALASVLCVAAGYTAVQENRWVTIPTTVEARSNSIAA